jgi:hypothetical protein
MMIHLSTPEKYLFSFYVMVFIMLYISLVASTENYAVLD